MSSEAKTVKGFARSWGWYRPGWQRLAAIALLGIFFAQALTTIPQLSLTADEPVYIGAGYAFLRSGDLRMATAAQHPPLMQELVALPLLLQPGPRLDALQGWNTAEMARFAPAFVAWYGESLDAATFAARVPVVWVALLWAAFMFRWAADWFGPWGGVVALTLFAFDPNILAHATLATNDVGFAAFSFIALFAATRFLRHRSRRYLVLAGLALGASLSAKSSGFFTALVLATLLPLAALISDKERGRRVVRAVLQLSLIVCLGLLVLWATYGFELRPFEGGNLPVPMATQWEVWREMREHLTGGHTAYFMGQIREAGGLAYYPLAFALKTPLFTLALLALGLVAAVVSGPRRWRATLPLWIYLGGYVAATLLSNVSTGYRFLLPILPFGFMLIAGLFRDGASSREHSGTHGVRWPRKPVRRWGGWVGLLLLGIAVSVRLHPDYLTYFNLLAGGPAGGHRYLVDSNLDWGQSLKALRSYLDEQEIEQVRLSFYTYADPALYDIRYQPIPPAKGAAPLLPARFNPSPGTYAISATVLQGVMTVDPDMYSWFQQRQPVARPGHAIYVYQVEEQDPRPTWLAQCTVPVAPLSPEVAVEGLGRDDLRLAYFDCTQSWLYPGDAATPGWYALHRDTALGGEHFIEERLDGARLSYEQRVDRASAAFVIYEQPAASPTATCPALRSGTQDVTPLPLDGPLSFLGYTLPEGPVHPGDTLEVVTYWQVTALPGDFASSAAPGDAGTEPGTGQRLLSLMLHLTGPGGGPNAVGDGLGVPIENWQVSDCIAQRHALPLPADAPPGEYTLTTGAYWLDTLERWAVLVDEKPAGDQIVLSSVVVAASR